MTSEMEKILGVAVGRDPSVPGTKPREGAEIVYFSDNGAGTFRDQFIGLCNDVNPRKAKHGGKTSEGCRIRVPDGTMFYAISYHGDLDGWRADIEAGATLHRSVLAHVNGDRLVAVDGRSFALSDCEVIFT
ncbi:hypothetical protein [Dyella choica]|uniref:Uncharacterized protein n=1 Tax=Dyella choica TaxID=1927959 RepID=A0A432LZA7_9GAMM|nr:hypothetical protein [Dyella choica]RUL68723.1 hypothetical protein EKH80_23280 [Dyella choica]